MKEKFAIVTGCASGIGKEVAARLRKEGIVVFGLDIKPCDEGYICDVSDESQVIKVLENISEKTDRIDFLINSAGMLTIGKPIEIKEIPIKQWEAILRVNLLSTLIMIKNTYPMLKKSDDASVVNISSEQSYLPQLGFAPYAVSKAAINTLTASAAQEFLNDKIRVNAIALGTVKTNILSSFCNDKDEIENLFKNKDQEIPFGVMNTSNVTDMVSFLLSYNARFITGEVLRVDGGRFLSNGL